MIELGPMTIGGIGVAALLALCFIGVRFAFAGAIVGTLGLMALIGVDAGIRTAGIVPFASGANYTLSVLWLRLVLQICGYMRMIAHPNAVPVAVPKLVTIETQVKDEIADALGKEAR